MSSKSISTRSKKNLQQASLLARQMKESFDGGDFIGGMVLAEKFLSALGSKIPPNLHETVIEIEKEATKSPRASKAYRA